MEFLESELSMRYVAARRPCGWSGQVSKFNRTCPKCTALGRFACRTVLVS